MALKPQEYFALQPWEFVAMLAGYQDRKKERLEYEQDMVLVMAWQIANFSRAKKIPDLKKVLGDVRRARGKAQKEARPNATNSELVQQARARGLKGPW